MKIKSDRRSFLKKIGIGGLTATVLPPTIINGESEIPRSNNFYNTTAEREYNGAYKNEYLKRVAFPIGGLGAGMFCLEGNGAISHMSVRSRPEVFNEPGIFGAIAVKGLKNGARVAEGPVPDWKRFGQPNTGNGAGGSIFGLPRFDEASFLSRFPFATISLKENDYPL